MDNERDKSSEGCDDRNHQCQVCALIRGPVILFVYPLFGFAVLLRAEIGMLNVTTDSTQPAFRKISSVLAAYHTPSPLLCRDVTFRTLSDSPVWAGIAV